MKFQEALHQITKNHKVTCPNWKYSGEYLFKDNRNRLIWWNGNSYEDVEVGYLSLWLRQDHDWELLK